MSIPKVIHFCWFGGNEYPETVKQCMKSWEKYCPDFEIRKWDEACFDVRQIPFTQEAYEAKKWAFVTDYARLKIIYENGGIYLDTDVELIKPITPLLEYKGYFGFEECSINTGLGFGAEAGNRFVKAMMYNYTGLHFINEDGSQNLTACPERDSMVLRDSGLKLSGEYQIIDGVHFLPQEYLCPLDWKTKELSVTDNTVSIHRYAASWHPDYIKKVRDIKNKYPPFIAEVMIRAMNASKRIKALFRNHSRK